MGRLSVPVAENEVAVLQGVADEMKKAERNLAGAQSDLRVLSAEADQLRQLQGNLDHCVAQCSTLASAVSSLEGQIGAQQALHQSIQSAVFSGRKHVALTEFRRDLCTAQRDVQNLEEAISCAQCCLASLGQALSDLKGRIEDLLHCPKPR